MTLIKCPECKKQTQDNIGACSNCGAPIDQKVFCVECGKPISAKASVCPNCGVSTGLDTKTTASRGHFQQDYVMLAMFILGGILLIIGIVVIQVPDREFSMYAIKEYVGGDAYNGIMEASVRGGEIAGSVISKATVSCTGLIIAALGAMRIKHNK